MLYANFRVGDVNISVDFSVTDFGCSRYFLPAQGQIDAALRVEWGYPVDGSPSVPQFSGTYMNVCIPDGQLFHLFRHVGYLAGAVSEKYRFCHGAGLSLDGKGVLLLGKSGNGKSTLASMLESVILDDDILLVSPSEMRRVGAFGGKINLGTNEVDFIEDSNYHLLLAFVFLLNNKYYPYHVKPEFLSL